MDFTTGLKIAVKAGLIAVVTVAVIALFANVQIPGLDFTVFGQALGKGLAILYHWCPACSIVVPVAVAMFGVYSAILLFEFAMIAVRWVFKVNE